MSMYKSVYRFRSNKFIPKDEYRIHKEQLNSQV